MTTKSGIFSFLLITDPVRYLMEIYSQSLVPTIDNINHGWTKLLMPLTLYREDARLLAHQLTAHNDSHLFLLPITTTQPSKPELTLYLPENEVEYGEGYLIATSSISNAEIVRGFKDLLSQRQIHLAAVKFFMLVHIGDDGRNSILYITNQSSIDPVIPSLLKELSSIGKEFVATYILNSQNDGKEHFSIENYEEAFHRFVFG